MQNAKTFRLFISSTFDDFKEERQVLHEKVFPEIENYLKNNHKNYNFQAIDLRWGVSTEAQLNQKTLDICLDEVEACKDYPHPNFLVMSGNRYGYVPLPYMIEESEFISITEYVEKYNEEIEIKYDPELNSQKEVKSQKESIKITPLDLLKSWYVLDKNQIYLTDKNTSTAYILQVRENDYKIYVNWKAEEDALRDILQEAANHIFKSNKNKEDEEYKKYFRSATEAEVNKGIINEYTFGFIREIINIDEHKKNVCNKQNPAYTFIDKNQEKAKKFKKKLVDELGSKNILDTEEYIEIQEYDNLIKACVELSNDTESVFLDNTYLDKFSDFMIDKLIGAINLHMGKAPDTPLKQEKDSHKKFKDDRSSIFVGREKLLYRTFVYINIDTSNTPLVIYGESGMGKSAFMAESINRVEKKNENVVYRFVGASADSSNIISLLISIVDQLGDEKYIDSVKEYATNRKKFYAQVRDILENKINKKVTIYIDAIDQLRSYNDLQWLPKTLNINLKMIFSVLKDYDYPDDSVYYEFLFEKYYENKGNFVDISKYSLEDNKETLIDQLLREENRKLNEAQIEYLIKRWSAANYSPLYLKIAIEEVRHWKSYDEWQKLADGVEGIILEFIKNLTGVYHHEKLLVEKVFGYIHASKDGLSEKELLEILSEDLEDEESFREVIINEYYTPVTVENPRRDNKEELMLPISVWSRLSTALKPFIVERNIDNQLLMKFFHRQFTTTVDNMISSNKISLHDKLARYFYTLQDKSKTWDERYYNLHMLDEYPYHLLYSYKAKKLKEILFDLEFAGSIYNNHKQAVFREIFSRAIELDDISEDELYPWESFYREKEHLILKVDEKHWRPHQSLFQLAYEDGDNSSLHLVASKLNIIDTVCLKRINIPENSKRNLLYSYTFKPEVEDVNEYSNIIILSSLFIVYLNKRIYIFDDKLKKLWDNKKYKLENSLKYKKIFKMKNLTCVGYEKSILCIDEKNDRFNFFKNKTLDELTIDGDTFYIMHYPHQAKEKNLYLNTLFIIYINNKDQIEVIYKGKAQKIKIIGTNAQYIHLRMAQQRLIYDKSKKQLYFNYKSDKNYMEDIQEYIYRDPDEYEEQYLDFYGSGDYAEDYNCSIEEADYAINKIEHKKTVDGQGKGLKQVTDKVSYIGRTYRIDEKYVINLSSNSIKIYKEEDNQVFDDNKTLEALYIRTKFGYQTNKNEVIYLIGENIFLKKSQGNLTLYDKGKEFYSCEEKINDFYVYGSKLVIMLKDKDTIIWLDFYNKKEIKPYIFSLQNIQNLEKIKIEDILGIAISTSGKLVLWYKKTIEEYEEGYTQISEDEWIRNDYYRSDIVCNLCLIEIKDKAVFYKDIGSFAECDVDHIENYLLSIDDFGQGYFIYYIKYDEGQPSYQLVNKGNINKKDSEYFKIIGNTFLAQKSLCVSSADNIKNNTRLSFYDCCSFMVADTESNSYVELSNQDKKEIYYIGKVNKIKFFNNTIIIYDGEDIKQYQIIENGSLT